MRRRCGPAYRLASRLSCPSCAAPSCRRPQAPSLSRPRPLRVHQQAGAAARARRGGGGAGRPEGRADRGGVDRHPGRLGERGHPAQGRGLRAAPALQGRAVRPPQRPPLRDRPPPVPGRPGAGPRHARPRGGPAREGQQRRRAVHAFGRAAGHQPAGARQRAGRRARRRGAAWPRRGAAVEQAALNLGVDAGDLADRRHRRHRPDAGRRPRQPAVRDDHGLDRRSHPRDHRHLRARVHGPRGDHQPRRTIRPPSTGRRSTSSSRTAACSPRRAGPCSWTARSTSRRAPSP